MLNNLWVFVGTHSVKKSELLPPLGFIEIVYQRFCGSLLRITIIIEEYQYFSWRVSLFLSSRVVCEISARGRHEPESLRIFIYHLLPVLWMSQTSSWLDWSKFPLYILGRPQSFRTISTQNLLPFHSNLSHTPGESPKNWFVKSLEFSFFLSFSLKLSQRRWIFSSFYSKISILVPFKCYDVIISL